MKVWLPLMAVALTLARGLCYGQSAPRLLRTFVPYGFEPNRGQADPRADFIAHGPGYTVLLAASEADLSFAGGNAAALHLRLLGANTRVKPEGRSLQTGRSNYFIGNTPRLWQTDIPRYGRVTYRGVYPGIDVEYYGRGRRLEYDFIVGPQADPGNICFDIEGAERIHIDETGDLVLTTAYTELRERKPTVYQDMPTGRRRIEGRFVVRGRNQVGFELASYDRRLPVTIDPVLLFSTYLGGSGLDSAVSIKLDAVGNIYIAGTTNSPNLRAQSISQPLSAGGSAAFVAKISPFGKLLFTTYIGAANDETVGNGIAVDRNSNIYLVGSTSSANFPLMNPLQRSYHGNMDAFVLELNSDGNRLIYSTCFGGGGRDYAHTIEVDGNANAYVTGSTTSRDFPTENPVQVHHGGGVFDAFALKISSGGSFLVYSTYLGGSKEDYTNGMTLDTSDNVYVFGDTESTDFPGTHNGFQPAHRGGNTDGWVTKLSPVGSLLYATYIGGSGGDSVRGGKADAIGNLLLTGATTSTDFPTARPIQRHYGGGSFDAWVAKLNPLGSALLYSTYLGGSRAEYGWDLAVDDRGNAYITGNTYSTDFPTLNAIQSKHGGGADAFLTKINAAGSAIVFSTYLGGMAGDYGAQLAVDSAARVYVAGRTESPDFPTVLPLQAAYGGGVSDAFVAIIATCAATFSAPYAVFGLAGGTGSISINTTPECGWTAVSDSPWISITSTPSGTGSGVVSYSAVQSPTPRVGGVKIGGQTFTILESDNVAPLSISPTAAIPGRSQSLMLTGGKFVSGATVAANHPGLRLSDVSVVSANKITATLNIDVNTIPGTASITVLTSDGAIGPANITINPPPPHRDRYGWYWSRARSFGSTHRMILIALLLGAATLAAGGGLLYRRLRLQSEKR